MKRLFDLFMAVIAVLLLFIPICVVAILVKVTSKGPALYWSDRVGINNTIFKMPKFRSMKTDTPTVATHLLKDPKSVLTPIGQFLRKSSLPYGVFINKVYVFQKCDFLFIKTSLPYCIFIFVVWEKVTCSWNK